MVFWAFFIILVLLLIIISFLRLSFMILVSFDGEGFHMEVKVMFYKLLTLYKWTFEEGGISFLFKKKKDVPEEYKKKKGRLSAVLEILFSRDTVRHLKKEMEILDVSVKGRISSKDAAQTALIYGGLWSAIGSLMPFIPQKRIILDFYADFHKDTPDLQISCILRVRITHIIVLIAEFKRDNFKESLR